MQEADAKTDPDAGAAPDKSINPQMTQMDADIKDDSYKTSAIICVICGSNG